MKKICRTSGGVVTNLPTFAGKVVAESVDQRKEPADFQRRQGQRSLCHHSDRAVSRRNSMSTSRSSTTWSPAVSWPPFIPHAEFEITTRISRIGDDAFKTDGKILVVPGWLEVYGKSAAQQASEEDEKGKNGDKILVPAERAKPPSARRSAIEDKETKPPARYNESTLLSAMETAGKRVDDEELREAMSERGLGTPATRASIIEGLINDKYLSRDGRDFSSATAACG